MGVGSNGAGDSWGNNGNSWIDGNPGWGGNGTSNEAGQQVDNVGQMRATNASMFANLRLNTDAGGDDANAPEISELGASYMRLRIRKRITADGGKSSKKKKKKKK